MDRMDQIDQRIDAMARRAAALHARVQRDAVVLDTPDDGTADVERAVERAAEAHRGQSTAFPGASMPT